MFAETIFVFIMGVFFFTVGIIGICNTKLSLNNLPILLFPIIGVGIMFISAAYIWDIPFLKYIRENGDTVIPLLSLLLFFIVGMTLVIGTMVDKKRKSECYTYELRAQCIDLGKRFQNDNDKQYTYSPSWKYTYGGKEYIYKSDYASNIIPPDIDGYSLILIDPAHPENVWVPEYSHHGKLFSAGIMFIIFSVVGLGIMFFK